jgi:hypothetical protein
VLLNRTADLFARLIAVSFTLVSGSALLATTLDYYRFNNDLSDSANAAHAGSVLAGVPGFSANVPSTPFANSASLSLGSGDAVQLNYAFPFDSPGDATLEFYVNPGSFNSGDIFWTTSGGGDANRFNIFLLNNLTGGYSLNIDYRQPDGTLHTLLNSEQPGGTQVNFAIPVGQWTFIAIVRSGNTYSVFFNHDTTPTASATDSSPVLPNSSGWTLNGRANLQNSCCQFTGLLDEVRLSDSALSPSEFLNNAGVPEPSTLLLSLAGMGLLIAARRAWRRD